MAKVSADAETPTGAVAGPVKGSHAAFGDAIVSAHELQLLEHRLGQQHARERLAVESWHEKRMLEQYLCLRRLETSLTPPLIEHTLRILGLYQRGRRNADAVAVHHHWVPSERLPAAFDGFVMLHLSDLHCDISPGAMANAAALLAGLRYDICVLTGDFRGPIYGPCDAALAAFRQLRAHLQGPVYGVLGDHDPARMLLALEGMQIKMLMNESVAIRRDGHVIHLAGIDDANFYRTHSIEDAAAGVPPDTFSVLLSHSPVVYREAAQAGFDLLISGHTHGGQICLPRGVPVTLKANVPRRLGAGAWRYAAMRGYTSVGLGTSALPVRFNCPPEITLHHLRKA
jgi:predicted MPP superfamily phosphohydrolase